MTPTKLGCGVWALKEDPVVTPKIIEKKSLLLDDGLRRQPEYKSILEASHAPVAYDVGAFIGYWSYFLLLDGFTTFSFEPYPDAFICLKNNLQHFDQAHVINRAVGDGSALNLRPSHLINRNPGTRQVAPDPKGDPSIRLDDWFQIETPPPPDLIKIDTEGAEVNVLQGAATLIKSYSPLLVIEIYPRQLETFSQSPESLYKLLHDLNYQSRPFVGKINSVRWDIIASPITQTR